MAARAGMQALVSRLRSFCEAATNDVFHGVTYWTDDQLQNELDAVQMQAWNIDLTPIARTIDGQTTYGKYAFQVPNGYWVENDFTLRNADGTAQSPSAYTVQAVPGGDTVVLTFTNDPGYVRLTLDANLYDWHQAAASVWEQKAAHRNTYVDVKAGDHRFAAEQEYKHCIQQRDWHRGQKVRSFPRNRVGYRTTGRLRRVR